MKQVHILLVEDNEADILLTKEAFEKSKILTLMSIAKNGKAALDILFRRNAHKNTPKPDLILLDINIPILNGHEVLKEIKKDNSVRKIPVIMLTTSSSQKDIEDAYEHHANSYVTKPIEMDDFLEAILKIEQFWLQLCKLP